MSGTPPRLADTTLHPKLSAPVDVSLPYGTDEIVPGTDLDLGFDSVLVDDRCPGASRCGAPGNAIVAIRIRLGSAPPFQALLNTAGPPRGFGIGAYEITLLELSPLPDTRTPMPQARYDVKLQVGSP